MFGIPKSLRYSTRRADPTAKPVRWRSALGTLRAGGDPTQPGGTARGGGLRARRPGRPSGSQQRRGCAPAPRLPADRAERAALAGVGRRGAQRVRTDPRRRRSPRSLDLAAESRLRTRDASGAGAPGGAQLRHQRRVEAHRSRSRAAATPGRGLHPAVRADRDGQRDPPGADLPHVRSGRRLPPGHDRGRRRGPGRPGESSAFPVPRGRVRAQRGIHGAELRGDPAQGPARGPGLSADGHGRRSRPREHLLGLRSALRSGGPALWQLRDGRHRLHLPGRSGAAASAHRGLAARRRRGPSRRNGRRPAHVSSRERLSGVRRRGRRSEAAGRLVVDRRPGRPRATVRCGSSAASTIG